MKSILWAQFSKDRRNPLLILLFISVSILATLLFAGNMHSPATIAIFSEEENAPEIEKKWESLLNVGETFNFEIMEPEAARESIRKGNMDVAVRLMETDYRLVAASERPSVSYVQQHVEKVFQREAQISAIESTEGKTIRDDIKDYLTDAPFQLQTKGIDREEIPGYNMSTQLMFAFTFLISMFILGFKVNNVTHDKVSGIWDRMILSPVKKAGMYFGYVLYSFLVTMFQITIVLLIFKYVLHYEVGNNLWLILLVAVFFTFGMISIAMLITGFVRTPEQFYAIYPSIIPILPLISGAYMMPGTITNPVLVFIADLFPVAHAMEAITSVIFYNAGFQDILMPLLFMLLIGVVAMGLGINLIERRSN